MEQDYPSEAQKLGKIFADCESGARQCKCWEDIMSILEEKGEKNLARQIGQEKCQDY